MRKKVPRSKGDESGRESVGLRVPPELHKRVRIGAIERGIKAQDLYEAGARLLLATPAGDYQPPGPDRTHEARELIRRALDVDLALQAQNVDIAALIAWLRVAKPADIERFRKAIAFHDKTTESKEISDNKEKRSIAS